MQRNLQWIWMLLIPFFSRAQQGSQIVYTADIDHFWQAYDSIQTTSDSLKKLQYIQTLYIDRGSPGLHAFMQARDYAGPLWVSLINSSPGFWKSIRPNTLAVHSKAGAIEKSIARLKQLYPELKPARMYFTIGGLRSGGTTNQDMILIGAEIATGTPHTDVSDLPAGTGKWLGGVFKEQKLDNIIPLNIHEYIHTQQRGEATNLLGLSIREGACDFITELVTGELMQTNYLRYGRIHEATLKEKFREDMFGDAYQRWMYNGDKAETVADLGYFMGYAICKSYYQHATRKRVAIRDIIELDYSRDSLVEDFLKRSKYFSGVLDKEALLKTFRSRIPVIERIEPLDVDSVLDASVKELTLQFSRPMDARSFSISLGPSGRDHFPITGVTGFSEDRRSFIVKLDLKPGNFYELEITGRGFKSAEGYPLKDRLIRFKTK